MLQHLVLLAAAPLAAQTQATPAVTATDPTPTPTPTPDPTPTAEADPAPAVPPVPAATPTPQASPRPVPSSTPVPEPTPTPTPEATPTPDAAPTDVSPPIAEPEATPDVAADLPGAVTTRVPDDARATDGGGGWLLWAGIAFVVLAAGIVLRVLLPRRRPRVVEPETVPDPVEPVAAMPARGAPAPTPMPAPSIDFRPSRIGLNLVSVTATGEITVRNDAPAAIHDVRVRASLLAAAAGHEDAVAALHRAPTGRLAAPPFALDPGQTRLVRLVVATPRTAIEPLGVGGRPMMVPLVAVGVDWRDAAGDHRRTQAFAVGVERVDSPKLAPVWLDQDSRSFDAVAARPHGKLLG